MLAHGQQHIRYWFNGIDDNYPFDLLKVALHTAKVNTSLTPICLHTGLNGDKISYLNSQKIIHFLIYPDKRIMFSHFYGALLRMYIPEICARLNINETVIYTDCDVIFFNHPPMIHTPYVGGVGCNPWVKPSAENVVNTGVLYLNIMPLRRSFDKFIKFAIENPDAHNAAAESIYNHFYDVNIIPHTLNYFAYWDVPNYTDIHVLHFHGPKPTDNGIHPDLNKIYYNKHLYQNVKYWRALRSSII